ncbi:alpha/beta fold hydrolase [Xylanibacter ruminicola]|uniref:Dipeptidyl aminopeptidase/acylaminoacyl peptidase n=1 Tax=Xylanibacter ruminicola TaxID=839 RepID=A0A1M6TA36_XYLRU|nr:S9 family peptidase [Xylanibacter ruminicola]SHK53922.1 Dipeptidyl aminopeptidase/acylaminoacyl peptidase [Xylanibacter ruminicola]
MKKSLVILILLANLVSLVNAQENVKIGKQNIKLSSNLMTPEALWAMGRIGAAEASADGKQIVYQIGYYSVKANKSQQKIAIINADGTGNTTLTTGTKSETDPTWYQGKIAFLSGGQLWTMNADGSDRKQISKTSKDIEGYKFSPDGKRVILLHSLEFNEIIKKNPDDLPKATGRLVTDLMYRHWDHYVESIQHPFVADVTENGIKDGIDILEGEPFECPMEPFGGIEQLDWSPDSKSIAYTCRKKTGLAYSISTDSDIYLYIIGTRETKNLCKPADYKAPEVDPTKTLKYQSVNAKENLQNNVGYDQNPKFSPDGKYVAWTSMEHDGYESDRNRLCVYNLASGEKKYVTESFDSNVDDFVWSDSKDVMIYFIGVWHATENLYAVNWKGELKQMNTMVTPQSASGCQEGNAWADFGSIHLMNNGKQLLMERHSITAPADLYIVTPNFKKPANTAVSQLTFENKHITDQLAKPSVQQRWVKTTDGKELLAWIILPPNFDASKKYPTLLFCEGGPQSPVSQFWSYRWNFFIMASQGYVVVAPNRRGLPGFGHEWLEEISGDWTGQCMDDYLSAIDDAANNLPYVDKDHLGAVGASFGGFSVYYLAGHHDKRFKAFISHDGAFNLAAMYTETEENWFSNWEYDEAYWHRPQLPNAKKTYHNSPHKFVEKWDTPILCIHGEKDYRINATQGMSAFNAARMKGIPAELLIFPDENHWVLKPQNGVLWQRTFFNWLDRWLK